MTKDIRFTKMHGAGNDYIYVNIQEYPLEQPEKLAVTWSTPHTGIGSDGLVLIGASDIADFSMHIYNADGSEATMCGNASRCIGKYVYETGLIHKKKITLETLSGIKELQLSVNKNDEVTEITVDMGTPIIEEIALNIQVDKTAYTGTIVSMGNPHLVIFTKNIEEIDLPTIGPLLENHPLFPERTNVEFVQVLSPDEVRMRVWERGSGITMACGTGACATAVAGVVNHKTERKTKIFMDGGTLSIHWKEHSGKVFMTGKAVTVFEGSIKIEQTHSIQ